MLFLCLHCHSQPSAMIRRAVLWYCFIKHSTKITVNYYTRKCSNLLAFRNNFRLLCALWCSIIHWLLTFLSWRNLVYPTGSFNWRRRICRAKMLVLIGVRFYNEEVEMLQGENCSLLKECLTPKGYIFHCKKEYCQGRKLVTY